MRTYQMMIALMFIFTVNEANSSPYPKVDTDLNEYDSKILQMKSDFEKIPSNINDKKWVKTKLQFLVDLDQFTRTRMQIPYQHNYSPDEIQIAIVEFSKRIASIDKENFIEVRSLLKVYEWFTISQFGEKSDKNAWLLVQHFDNESNFQKTILAILERLYKINETNPQNYAYLYDRVAASYADPSKRTLQRYGTQGMCVGPGLWEPLPIENPDLVDQRRVEVRLNTLEEYKKVFKDLCH